MLINTRGPSNKVHHKTLPLLILPTSSELKSIKMETITTTSIALHTNVFVCQRFADGSDAVLQQPPPEASHAGTRAR